MLTVIIILVMLVIAVGLVALYREVGLGRDNEGSSSALSPSTSKWPFGNLATGKDLAGLAGRNGAGLADDPVTGFVALCTDDADALGVLYSVAVVAEDWGYPMVVAVGKTLQPNGWTHRLDSLPGTVTQHDVRIDEISSLQPARLPVVVFVNEGRVLDASLALDSPSSIARDFQRCRFGLKR